MKRTLRIGTRGSQLALWQARWVQTALQGLSADLNVELVVIRTKGDKILDVPLAKVGGKGLFVKEIEDALLDGRVDLAVHSMKDMPAHLPAGLRIGAIPRRAAPFDALVCRTCSRVEDLPPSARIGTSSLRRSAQLLHLRPDLIIEPLRGNLDTRLKKLDTAELDAIILAAAGLQRLGLGDRISAVLPQTTMLPAVGQGALCIESRERDEVADPLLEKLDDTDTRDAVRAERAFLARLEGGCQVPIAGHGIVDGGRVHLRGLVAELDGSRIIDATLEGPRADAESIGRELAEQLLSRGADSILKRLQQHAQ